MQRRDEAPHRRGPDARRIAGILMEEAILYLLETAGYRTVLAANGDPTLHEEHDELSILGRGGRHQIDGIADFAIGHPFSHPQRLLVEVKFHGRPLDSEVILKAASVLQDVRGYWRAYQDENEAVRPRYHYVYAIFSASWCSANAQRFAYAHDIYLIPLTRSAFIQPIIAAIQTIKGFTLPPHSPQRRLLKKEMSVPYDPSAIGLAHPELRRYVRANIRGQYGYELSDIVRDTALNLLSHFCQACREINGAVLGMIARQFPVFLVPGPDIDLDYLRDCSVKIYWDSNSWYLKLNGGGSFSFDLPTELLNQYVEHGMLSRTRALDLKTDYLFEIQAVIRKEDTIRIVTFRLDQSWLERLILFQELDDMFVLTASTHQG